MTMTRAQALDYVNQQNPTFLTPAADTSLRNGRPMFKCPCCPHGSGKGSGGDGICIIPESVRTGHPRWKCFSCGMVEDVAGLWAKVHPGDNNFSQLYQYFNLDVETGAEAFERSESAVDFGPGAEAGAATSQDRQAGASSQSSQESRQEQQAQASAEPSPVEIPQEYFTEENIKKAVRYLATRGICEKLVRDCGIGFDSVHGSLVIPTGNGSYIQRVVSPNAKTRYYKHGPVQLYLLEAALKYGTDRPVWVVEGEIDALSIWEAGGIAVGLGSTTKAKDFEERVKSLKNVRFIIALDNDEDGQKTAKSLEQLMQADHLSFYRPDALGLYGTAKDANEALTQNGEAFRERVAMIERKLTMTPEERYQEQDTAGACARLLKGAYTAKPRVPSPFDNLNEILHGGFRAGLYTLGAVTGAGKTTIAIQIADFMASKGYDVVYISLEMAEHEIVARSLSRLTSEIRTALTDDRRTVWSAVDIIDGDPSASADKRRVLEAAAERYQRTIAPHFWIAEGTDDLTVADIRGLVAAHVNARHRSPVVFVDYLQLVAPPADVDGKELHLTDKQVIDRNIKQFKYLSRDYKTPVICITSYNRNSYDAKASLKSAKDSGSQEYTSDVVLALQYFGTGEEWFNLEDAQGKSPREIELCVLKNRNGPNGKRVQLEYRSRTNRFLQASEPFRVPVKPDGKGDGKK